jgi:hypothetical protein
VNEAILAPAGGRKTQHIVQACSEGEPSRSRLVITFTSDAQNILISRLYHSCATTSMPDVLGWYGFLLRHIIRPYVNCLYDIDELGGLYFVTRYDPGIKAPGQRRYFDTSGRVYSTRISLLAMKIISTTKGAPIDRLERIYDEIYIDEVQDLSGNDLDILDLLLTSKIDVMLVGDIRQSLLTTSRSDRKNRAYAGLGMINWFRERDARGILRLTEGTVSWRCSQEIIDLADRALPKDTFLATTSEASPASGGQHTGVWAVSRKHAVHYFTRYTPAVFRDSTRTRVPDEIHGAINFGHCKGMTVGHSLIFPTNTMIDFLAGKSDSLAERSAARLYVAISRAIYSVAIAVDNPGELNIPEWTPLSIC